MGFIEDGQDERLTALQAEIALAETGLPFRRVEIDLRNKPEWYPNVNPRGQVRYQPTPSLALETNSQS